VNSIFIMHLIATLVNTTVILLVWRYNTKLININHKKINDLSARMPGTMWMDIDTGKTFVRAKVTEPLKESCDIGKDKKSTDTKDPKFKADMQRALNCLDEIEATIDKINKKETK